MAIVSVHTKMIVSTIKYSRRLPMKWMVNKNMKLATIFSVCNTVAASSGFIGTSYALKIWMINGRIATSRAICKIKSSVSTMANGLRLCLRFNCASFSMNVGGGWVHSRFFLLHGTQDLVRSLYRCSEWNSSMAAASEIHPRSHLSAFNPSSDRFFDSNHIGDSGT